MTPDEPRLLFKDAIGFSGVWRDVHFDRTNTKADLAHMKVRFAAQDEWVATLAPGREILSLSVITESAVTMIDGELRALVDAHVKKLAPRTRAAALVIEATGVKAAVLRSIIAGLTMITSRRYETKTAATMEEALAWLAPQLDDVGGRRPSVDELREAWSKISSAAGQT